MKLEPLGDDGVRLEMTATETRLILELRSALHSLLTDPDGDDPVVRRLFPRTVDADDDADTELRGLIHNDLLTSRLEGLDEVADILERGRLPSEGVETILREDEPLLLLGVLNDLRLALGVRVGIDHVDRDQLEQDDVAHQTLGLMDALAWMQEQILVVVDPHALDFYDDPPTGS